jgi:hypothetical protein
VAADWLPVFFMNRAAERGEQPMVKENRIYHSLFAMTRTPLPARNAAEFLRDLGLVLRQRMRRMVGARRALLFLRALCWDGRLALRFTSLGLSVQLRAMVEDWPLSLIQDTVAAQRLETLRPQEGSRPATLKEIPYGGTF